MIFHKEKKAKSISQYHIVHKRLIHNILCVILQHHSISHNITQRNPSPTPRVKGRKFTRVLQERCFRHLYTICPHKWNSVLKNAVLNISPPFWNSPRLLERGRGWGLGEGLGVGTVILRNKIEGNGRFCVGKKRWPHPCPSPTGAGSQ